MTIGADHPGASNGAATNGAATNGAASIVACAGEERLRLRVADAMADSGEVLVMAIDIDELLESIEASPVKVACVVLAGVRLDAGIGEVVARIRSRVPTASVVAVSDRAGAGDIRRAIGFGIDGVVLEQRIEQTLGVVVEAAVSGQTSVPSAHRSELTVEVLTGREKEALALVAAGLSNAEIAAKLFLAESTVKSHLSSAFRKLNVSSRHEAAILVLDPDRGKDLGIYAPPTVLPAPA